MEEITLGQLEEKFKKAHEDGELGYSLNSYRTTLKDFPWLAKIDGGLNRNISEITSKDIEKWSDRVSFGKNFLGKAMSPAGASSVYNSGKRLFTFAVDMGYLTVSPFEGVRPSYVPRVLNKENAKRVKGTAPFTADDGKNLIHGLVHADPTFSAVKSTLFTYMAYRYSKAPGYLLLMSWDQFNSEAFATSDSFLKALAANYHEALSKWSENNNVKNDKNLFFVMNKGDCVAEPMDSGYVGSWVKKNILKPNHLPNMTAFMLSSKDAPREGVFEQVDAYDGELPILGPITFPTFGGGGARLDYETYLAERKARAEAYQEED